MYKRLLPVVLVCVITALFTFLFGSRLRDAGFSTDFLHVANLLLFVLTAIAFLMQAHGATSQNNHALMRSILGSLMLKMFLIIIVLGIYLFFAGREINKPSLFTSMGLYIVYMVLEVKLLQNLVRSK